MTTIWGIHNNLPSLDLVTNGFVSIGWDELGDPRSIGNDCEALKSHLGATYLDAKQEALPVWAGLVLRFVYEMKPGDLVIDPHKPDSTLNFGRVISDYQWDGVCRDPPEPASRRMDPDVSSANGLFGDGSLRSRIGVDAVQSAEGSA